MVRTSVFHPRESETDRVLNRITCCPDCFEVCHRDEASSRLLLLGALLGAATGYHAFSPDHESTVFGRNVEGLRPDPVADEVAAKRQEREGEARREVRRGTRREVGRRSTTTSMTKSTTEATLLVELEEPRGQKSPSTTRRCGCGDRTKRSSGPSWRRSPRAINKV